MMRRFKFLPMSGNVFMVGVVFFLIIFYAVFSDFYHVKHMHLHSNAEKNHLYNTVHKIKNMVAENQAVIDKLQRQLDESRVVLLNKVKHDLKINISDVVMKQSEKKQEVISPNQIQIPILVTACNRPTVSRCVDQLLHLQKQVSDDFPVLVSQDCNDAVTAGVLQGYGDKIKYIKHPPVDASILKGVKTHLQGYYKLSLHYKWAISKTFEMFPKAKSMIIVEDDIDVAVDFLSYFRAMHDLLDTDDSLWCASAWNDNGKSELIDESQEGSKMLYRTDFFPGLGWMLKKSLWIEELESKWPTAYWDDWMRNNKQRKDRACIRPEISRTITFGKKGVSNGQFYEKHLKYIQLNQRNINWQIEDLSYLKKENYDRTFVEHVKELPLKFISELHTNTDAEIKLQYKQAAEFKLLSVKLGTMVDFKDGVPRTAYKGIVTVLYNHKRVFLTPPDDWKGYDSSWK